MQYTEIMQMKAEAGRMTLDDTRRRDDESGTH